MTASHSPPSSPYLSIGNVRAGDLIEPLRAMLADDDWRPACHNLEQLTALLERLDHDAGAVDEPPPPGVISILSAHADFCRFRRDAAATLNTPDSETLHVTPEEWLQYRLRHYGETSETEASFGDYRVHRQPFRVS